MDRGVPKCNNCNGQYTLYVLYRLHVSADTNQELGHMARACPEDKMEIEFTEVKCVNCDEAGHRARDCTKARVDRFACRNCK